MNSAEQTSLIAFGLVFIALINWVDADRSFFGRELRVRHGWMWISFRWLGLGLWFVSLSAPEHGGSWLPYVGLVGAAMLLLGTARQPTPIRKPAREQQQAEGS